MKSWVLLVLVLFVSLNVQAEKKHIFPITNVYKLVFNESTSRYEKELLPPTCLNLNLKKAYESFENYQNYKNLDDEIEFFVPLTHTKQIEMIESSSQAMKEWSMPWPSEFEKESHDPNWTYRFDVVDFKFLPVLASEEQFFPRFSAECALGKNEQGFQQLCKFAGATVPLAKNDTIKNTNHFALADFKSKVKVVINAPQCGRSNRGKTLLQYEVKLVTESDDVDQLKNHLVNGSYLGRKVVDALFEENAFFQGYYEYLFDAWIKKLQ